MSKLEKLASRQPLPLPDTIFGELVPFGDPTWYQVRIYIIVNSQYQGWASPYYNDSHKRFREFVRKFVDEEVIPNVHRWDEGWYLG